MLTTSGGRLSGAQWLTVLLFSVAIFASLDLAGLKAYRARAGLGPSPDFAGPVAVVLYGDRYASYLSTGALKVPPVGWRVVKFGNGTSLHAEPGAEPLQIQSDTEPVLLGVVHSPLGGEVRLVDGQGAVVASISLRSETEHVSTLEIGGDRSAVPREVRGLSPLALFGSWAAIVAILASVALAMRFVRPDAPAGGAEPERYETLWLALPLFASSTVVLLAYWPGNFSYDGSLQWMQATVPGSQIVPGSGSLILLLRLFSGLSAFPAVIIVAQSLASAFGVAAILIELRYRGVPRWAAMASVLAMSVTPQYPLFVTAVGKDALSFVGLLFMVSALLAIARDWKSGETQPLRLLRLIGGAAFAGVMRPNAVPTAVLAVVVVVAVLFFRGRRLPAVLSLAGFVALAVVVPGLAYHFSYEGTGARARSPDIPVLAPATEAPPVSLVANIYMFHLFAAAVHSGMDISPRDSNLFYRIAPRSAWSKYDCAMVDPTLMALAETTLMTPEERTLFAGEHYNDLQRALFRIFAERPSVLLDRQLCITRLLWHVGVGQKPFETTGVLGYDSIAPGFSALVGDNRSLLPGGIRESIGAYVAWTESERWFWLFWKPALVLYVGLFVAINRLLVRFDLGILMALAIPLSLTAVMAVVIPFPAYRYQYPSAAIMSLLSILVASATPRLGGRAIRPKASAGIEEEGSNITAGARRPLGETH